MIVFNDIKEYIELAKTAAPAVNFASLKFYITTSRFINNQGEVRRGEYRWGKSITLAKGLSKKEGLAVFLHELGHHLVWLQFGDELCRTFSKYEHEVFADRFATEMANELSFDYERYMGRPAYCISQAYSRNFSALNE